VSPNRLIPGENGPLNPIAERVSQDERLTRHFSDDALVIAVSRELIVRPGALTDDARRELEAVAESVGTLWDVLKAGPATDGLPDPYPWSGPAGPIDDDYFPEEPTDPEERSPLKELEIWRLDDPHDAIDIAMGLRQHADPAREHVRTSTGHALRLPAVQPHHVSILSATGGGCPAAPPIPAPPPDALFVTPPPRGGSTAKVTILDSGYIWLDPRHLDASHHNLNDRVTVVLGQRLDQTGAWVPDEPDALYTDPDGQLDGITGHGTFIAGLISQIAPNTRLEVVGLRNQEVTIRPLTRAVQLGLFETELAIARAMLRRSNTDVIQCGFAFPTLDDYPSLPFWAVMEELRKPRAPHGGRVAVVAPAGNERSRRKYWPAALPDVIGVASTNRRGDARAWFSNWGSWCNCCTRGESVYSTFVHWDGPIEGEPRTDIEHFQGWARWDGTSFAAPKVSAEIARLIADSQNTVAPVTAGNRLLAGNGGIQVQTISDATLPPPAVSLPYLQIG
jgi:hypothetical protein